MPQLRLRRLQVVATLAATWLVLGCGALEPEEEPVHVTTDRSTYRAGDEVALRIENRGDRPITYGCGSGGFERLAGIVWVPISALPPGAICTGVGFTLQPGQVLHWSATLPAHLSPGRYRYRFSGGTSDAFGVVSP